METLAFIRALIGLMHSAIAAGMHPLTGEMTMTDERKRSLVVDTFAAIREAYAAVVKASEETTEVKTKRESAHKKHSAEFAGLLEAALSQKTPPKWATVYRDMTATAKPAGGDRETANEIQSLHDAQRKMLTETFIVTNPWLAGIDEVLPRLGTKGRPAGSRNKPKDESDSEVSNTSESDDSEVVTA